MESKWIHVLLLGVICFSVRSMGAYIQQGRHEYLSFPLSSTPGETPSAKKLYSKDDGYFHGVNIQLGQDMYSYFPSSSTSDETPSAMKLYSKKYGYFHDDSDVGNANAFVDATLENLRKDPEISKYINPLKIPDIDEDGFRVRNFNIYGLLSLYRYGDCSLTYDGDTVTVIAELAVKDVSVKLDYTAWIWKEWFYRTSGEGEIGVDNLAVRLDFSSTNGNAHLNSFKVVNLGNYSVKKITGLGFLYNWLLKILANSVAQGARQTIINALENEAGKAIDNLLKQYKFPIF